MCILLIYPVHQIICKHNNNFLMKMFGIIKGSQQKRPRRGPGNQIYVIANPATTIHQEHAPRIKIIPLLDNRYDAFDYDNHICQH